MLASTYTTSEFSPLSEYYFIDWSVFLAGASL